MSFGGQEKMIRSLSSENWQIWKWWDQENIYTYWWFILTKKYHQPDLVELKWWSSFHQKKLVDQNFSPLLGKSKKNLVRFPTSNSVVGAWGRVFNLVIEQLNRERKQVWETKKTLLWSWETWRLWRIRKLRWSTRSTLGGHCTLEDRWASPSCQNPQPTPRHNWLQEIDISWQGRSHWDILSSPVT